MNQFLANLLYALAIKVAGAIYNKFLMHKVEENEKEIAKQRKALTKAISKAESDEERATFSIILGKLNRGELSK